MGKLVYNLLAAMFAILEVKGFQQESCPYKGCDCVEGIIDCGYHGWKTIPELLLPQGNPLSTIPAGSLPALIQGINFQDNPLLNIDDTAFDGSSNTMKKLEFSDAHFTRIPNALGHLNVLESLSVEDTKIDDWNVDVMKQIGKTVTGLTLDNVGLSAWPTWIQNFLHLQILQITNFNMSTIPDNALDVQSKELTTLSLEFGTLSEIPSAVSKLSALSYLDLDENRITELTNLPSFGNLTNLSLNNNTLSNSKSISNSLRSVADSLLTLQLNGNQLMAFPEMSFMTKLQYVYLLDNSIFDTVSGSIPPSLMILDLEGNNFRSIPIFLAGDGSIDTLRLSRNAITDIVDSRIPVNVIDLDLARNKITELTNQSFPLNSKLQILTLDYNPISNIQPVAFAALKHMLYLSMRNTRLTRLPLSLTSLSPLGALDLNENIYLICTCLEKPLRPWALALKLQSYGTCGNVSVDTFLKVLSADCPD